MFKTLWTVSIRLPRLRDRWFDTESEAEECARGFGLLWPKAQVRVYRRVIRCAP